LLGRHLVGQLCDRGYPVRVLVRTPKLSEPFPGNVEVRAGDILSKEDVHAAVSDCSYVFHACSTHVYNLPAEEMWAVNVQGTRNICEAVKRYGCDRLVFTSTVSALKARTPAVKPDAKMPARQRNSVNKQLADELVVSGAQHGLPAVIVSPSYFIGPLDYSPSPFRLWIPMAVARPVKWVPSGGFNVVGAADVARAHIWALEKGNLGEHYPITGDNISIAEFVAMVNRAAGSEYSPKTISPRVLALVSHGRVLDGYVASMLSKPNFADVPWQYPFPMQPLAGVVRETVDWFRSNSSLIRFSALLQYAWRRYI
jgi:dihydroflavonol-4-reductase